MFQHAFSFFAFFFRDVLEERHFLCFFLFLSAFSDFVFFFFLVTLSLISSRSTGSISCAAGLELSAKTACGSGSASGSVKVVFSSASEEHAKVASECCSLTSAPSAANTRQNELWRKYC
jgi:hypothetical protein